MTVVLSHQGNECKQFFYFVAYSATLHTTPNQKKLGHFVQFSRFCDLFILFNLLLAVQKYKEKFSNVFTNFDFDDCNTPQSWDRDQIQVKRLSKLDYPTILKQVNW